MKKKFTIADVVIYIVVLFLGLICLLPLLNIVALSLSDKAAASSGEVGIVPIKFTLNSYKMILEESQLWHSFLISVERVLLGTTINVVLVLTMAYPLSKDKREFRAKKVYMTLVLIAMLFNGGMIPTYLVVYKLKLINTMWSLVLPTAVGVGNVILLMNFYKSVPKSLEEAAEIDGATPFQILRNVYIPASKACIATIVLFCMVGHWNDYFSGILYLSNIAKYPLQTYISLIKADVSINAVTDVKKLAFLSKVGARTLSAAKIVVTVIPLMCVYPIMQRYFVTGIVVGAVKE